MVRRLNLLQVNIFTEILMLYVIALIWPNWHISAKKYACIRIYFFIAVCLRRNELLVQKRNPVNEHLRI